jgi:hypothetical protein
MMNYTSPPTPEKAPPQFNKKPFISRYNYLTSDSCKDQEVSSSIIRDTIAKLFGFDEQKHDQFIYSGRALND